MSRLGAIAIAWCLLLLASLPAQAETDANRIAALRGELESKDQERIAAARQQVLALPRPEQVDFCRDALWSRDHKAAVWCANQLQYDQVDLREAAQVIDLLMPELCKPAVLDEDKLHFDNFRQLLGSSELPRLFKAFPKSSESPGPGVILTQIHRQVRPAHVPAMCQLAMAEDPRIAEPALAMVIGAIAPHTNQHRDAIGLALLHRVKVKVPAGDRDRPRDGYPLVLNKCLQSFQRFRVLADHTGAAHNWIWRWAVEENAGPADRDVLLRLLGMDDELARSIAAHGLGELPEARRRRQEARLLFHGDPKQRAAALGLCTEDRHDLALVGIRVRREWFDGLKVPETDLPGLHLAQVVMHVPGFRRVDLAQRAAVQADLRKPKGPQADLEDFLAFLEVTSPDHLLALLATWAASDDKELGKHARKLQLRVGDETAVNELLAVLEGEDLDEQAPIWLGRMKSPKVEGFLRRRARTADPKTAPRYVCALAVHYGLPESVGWERKLREVDDAVFAKAKALVLERKPIDALVHVLNSLEDSETFVEDLGLVRDPRVTRYLEQVQGRRYLGRYAWATSQLAIQGSSKAREEFWQGCLIGRYRWIDHQNVRALTLGFDPWTIPFWLGELETNCCRRNSAAQVFEKLFGLDLYLDNKVLPEVVQARTFWERCRNDLRWSRIKGHYVPGPDR